LPKRKTRRAKREAPPLPPPPPSKWKRLVGALTLAGIILAPVTGIAGLAEFALSTIPDFSYLQLIAVDPANPYGFRFVFVNNGHLSAHSVMYACYTSPRFDTSLAPPDYPSDKDTIFFARHIENGVFRHAAIQVAPFEDVSVACHDDVPAKTIISANLAITIRYRPSWVIWRVRHAFAFKLHVGKDRSFQWVPEAMQGENDKSDNPDPLYPEPNSN
jgi:hypothetical protein